MWSIETNTAFAKLMAQVQTTHSYKKQFPSGDGYPDFFYGEKTRQAMCELGYDYRLIRAIDNLHHSGELNDLYWGADNPRELLANVKSPEVEQTHEIPPLQPIHYMLMHGGGM